MSNDTAHAAAPHQRPATRVPAPISDPPCASCPLRALPCFQPVRAEELQTIDQLKQAELPFAAGSTLIAEGGDDSPLYTLLQGWAFRAKGLADGRRQILGVLLPGDFIGLQQRMTERSQHAVLALTDVRVCTFQRDAIRRIHERLPSLAMDLTWIAARGESLVDDHLLSVGRRTARERIAATLLVLWLRTARLGMHLPGGGLPLPLKQRHLADLLGLSLVHTNRNLRSLVAAGLLRFAGDGLMHIEDPAALAQAGQLRWPIAVPDVPLI
ncbi:Crp/Fnr family transcriptional regulator [Aquabacterium sp. OR-4]|uniref:Crp/Fnr family transcriptional regulator n=1 Tax=Aquabacterium sp. OR-4 TaxID=2978127 RepID=UPI0021B3D269|nr:Crp/Fnr family transcriptional regulator [Aquabacterium sp. OR-4]MDT7835040.1 Crp/Fnr family transcriptional regulator [Aquabacterium sp. OR-4]